jgi:hypothetical protein
MQSALMIFAATYALNLHADALTQRQIVVGEFERVYLSGAVQLHLQQGLASTALGTAKVTGPLDSLEQVIVEFGDGVLYIDVPATQVTSPIIIHLPVGQLKEIVGSDGARVFAAQLESPSLALESRGDGQFVLQAMLVDDLVIVGRGNTDFILSGVVQHQVIELAGLGSYHGADLQSQTSHVSVQGAGEVDIWVQDLLEVNVYGAAKVRYDGSPWVQQQVHGTGAISRRF